MKQVKKSLFLLLMIYLAFVSLGLPDGVLGVAWPAIRADFGMPLEQIGLLTTLLLVTSALSSFFSGRVLARFGTGGVTLASGLLTALGLLGFSFSPGFGWLLFFIFPLGIGQGAVDAGLNLYVAEHYSAGQMNRLHCFWGVGASLGPLVMARALTATGWRSGYSVLAYIQLSLAAVLLISLVGGLWRVDGTERKHGEQEAVPCGTLCSVPDQLLAVLLFFLYAGVEYCVGTWLNSVLIESRGFAVIHAGLAVSLFYASIMSGRLLSGFFVGRVGNRRMIGLGLCIGMAGAVLLACAGERGATVFVGTAALGIGLAPVYPCLMHETPRRFVPAVTRRLIGFQVGAACLGGSAVSAGAGMLFSRFSLELLFPLLLALLLLALIGNEHLARRASHQR